MTGDPFTTSRMTAVLQGEYRVTADQNVVFSTILGSCVAACLFDRTNGCGGINHFLLPSTQDAGSSSARYGVNAMELLINGLLKLGAKRHSIEAKVFGGSSMSQSAASIGVSNQDFATEFLKSEGIPVVGRSLGGTKARRIRFHPTTGRVQQIFVEQDALQNKRLDPPKRVARDKKPSITFFD